MLSGLAVIDAKNEYYNFAPIARVSVESHPLRASAKS
jgi:hypothetical protein